MVEREEPADLSAILKAAADPTRRSILTLLAQHGPLRVTEIARHFAVSLAAVSKHIQVLEAAGLVERRTEWREHMIAVRLGPLSAIDTWFAGLRSIWALRLAALDSVLKEDDPMPDLALEVTQTIKAPPERVFDAWLDPAMLARFMLPGPDMSVPEAEVDARVGGRFRLVMRAGDRDMPHAGEYRVIDRPRRLQFTWESPFSIDGSTVTLDFAAVQGGTQVRLHHIRFPSEESRANHEGGWGRILAVCADVVGT